MEMIRVCRHVICRQNVYHQKKKKHRMFDDLFMLFLLCNVDSYEVFSIVFHHNINISNFILELVYFKLSYIFAS